MVGSCEFEALDPFLLYQRTLPGRDVRYDAPQPWRRQDVSEYVTHQGNCSPR